MQVGFLSRFSCNVQNEATPHKYVGYLPAAHILEFTAEMSLLTLGGQIGFSDVKSFASKVIP